MLTRLERSPQHTHLHMDLRSQRVAEEKMKSVRKHFVPADALSASLSLSARKNSADKKCRSVITPSLATKMQVLFERRRVGGVKQPLFKVFFETESSRQDGSGFYTHKHL